MKLFFCFFLLLPSSVFSAEWTHYQVLKQTETSTQIQFASGAKALLGVDCVVRFKSSIAERRFFKSSGKTRNFSALSLVPQTYILKSKSVSEMRQNCDQINANENVRFAHPDFKMEIEARSTTRNIEDPLFPLMWHYRTTGMDRVLANSDGGAEIVVALLDLGFEASHPDLKDSWFVNRSEIAGNGIDDDHNGFKDDFSGWNFATNSNNLLYGASNSHGTATAGIIGARANGIGVIGGCPTCKILPIVIDGTVSKDAQAFYYAKSLGAAVASNSWGYKIGTPETEVITTALTEVARDSRNGLGMTIVFAMSNFDENDCRGSTPDISSHPSVIAVSSSDQHDFKVDSSGFGGCLKFLAPSSADALNGIVTTDRIGDKGFNQSGANGNLPDLDYSNGFFGTSAAAPQVAALFGFLYSMKPSLTAAQTLNYVRANVDKVHENEAAYDSVTGLSLRYGYGRINAWNAYQNLKGDIQHEK